MTLKGLPTDRPTVVSSFYDRSAPASVLTATADLVEHYEVTETVPMASPYRAAALARCLNLAERWLAAHGLEAVIHEVHRYSGSEFQIGVEWQVQVGRAKATVDRPAALDAAPWVWSDRWRHWLREFVHMRVPTVPKPKSPVSAFDADAVHDSVGFYDDFDFDPGATGLGPAPQGWSNL